MNRIFKSKWSIARQTYVVTDEAHTSKDHKKTIAAAMSAAIAMIAGAAQAAYMEPTYQDPGFVAQNSSQVSDAKSSWETAEYLKNWGLTAQKASSAYALGYHGQGVKVGQMDSGILKDHVELSGDRWHAVSASGEYTHDGVRYPQGPSKDSNEEANNSYHAGDKFDVDGYYNDQINDNHGTGCAGVYAGNRDGQGMHGVAWGSEFYSANSGGTDNSNYGPFPDYGFFKAGYDALVESGVKIINNSWGTNLKQVDENGDVVDYTYSGPELTTVKDIEYEYFMFKQNYNGGPSFVDAAWDAVKGKDVIQAFSAGNNDRANPYHRGLFPYFKPEAEKQWLVVSGLQEASGNKYKLIDTFNEAGYAKYWTMTAPGSNGNTSNISGGYGGYSGTSMATPFVSGAFAVIASRYTDMTAVQAREVLLTTASHQNADGSVIEGWANVDGSMPAEGEVSDRMGWGVPDLEKGMWGPGQFFNGNFNYDLNSSLDVWSNDISQVAQDQRRKEDIEWLKGATKDGSLDGEIVVSDDAADYKLTNTSTAEANPDHQEHNYDLAGIANKNVSLADAQKWRLQYYEDRAAAIRAKLADGSYDGSLTKRGVGTLVMTGNNTYRGGTTVEEGTLVGFAESFGVTGDNAQAKANGQVTVNGGAFGIINSYDDQFTKKGQLQSAVSPDHSVDVTVNAGGTYLVSAGEDVNVGKLDFKTGSALSVWSADADALASAYTDGTKLTGTVTADTLTGEAVAKSHLAFFDATATTEGNKITATLEKKQGGMAAAASTANGRSIGAAIEANPESEFFKSFIGATTTEAQNTFGSLGSDELLNASTASIMNTVTLTRAVQEQAQGIGSGRFVEMADGTARLWATGIGSWGDVDFGQSSIDNDFYAGLFGAEVDVCPAAKIGVFFGAGTTETKGDGKLESDDIHFGAYAVSNVADVAAFNFGFTYTQQDREGHRALTVGSSTAVNSITSDADIAQIFAEAAYTGFNTDAYSVEPYVGFSWMHVTADDFSETVGTANIRTDNENQNLQMTTLGVRGELPFTVGSMGFSVKGDLSWMHFFGDTSPEASLQIADAGTAVIEGGELDNLVGVSLGVEANLTKSTTFGLSYTGAYNSDVNTSGLYANVRFAF